MANKLVGYDSGEDSENTDDLSNNQSHFEHSTEQIEAAFASEWECFERLIAGPSNESAVADSGITHAPKLVQKRIFREEAGSDDSDSDVSNESVSKDKSSEVSDTKLDASKVGQRLKSSSVSPAHSLSANETESDSSDDAPTAQKRPSLADDDDKLKCAERLAKSDSMKPDVSSTRRVSEEKKERAELVHSDSKSSRDGGCGSREGTGVDAARKQGGVADGKSRDKRSAVVESRTSGSRGEQERRPSGRKRSPSPHSSRRRDGHGSSRRSRSRSRDRRHRSRSHSRERRRERRSRSRSADKHRSRHHRGHDRYPSPRSRRHGSRERRRSRTRSPPVQPANADKPIKNQPLNFKEQLKAQLVSAAQQQAANAAAAAEAAIGMVSPTTSQPIGTGTAADIAKMLEVRAMLKANEKPSNLPLAAGNALAASGKDRVTPQQALAQTMAAMHQKVQELTGVAVPSYYNIAAVNPLKYAEQLKKRKLLWSKAPKETNEGETSQPSVRAVQSVAQWTGSSFAADTDGKQAEKFRKLMGIKEEDKILLADNVDISKLTEEQRRRQDELFQQLDREYAFARMSTHTHRGVGLGFQSQGLPDP